MLQSVLFAEYVVRPWDLSRDPDSDIHTLNYMLLKHMHLSSFTAKSEELREFRRGTEGRMYGTSCVERKNQRRRRERWESNRTTRTSFVYRAVSGLRSLLYVARSSEQMGRMLYGGTDATISKRNLLYNKHSQCRKLHSKCSQEHSMSYI